MSNVKLGKSSVAKLATIKPALREVCLKAFETMPFDITVLEGTRSLDRQKELVAQGASKTLKSKHLTGDAVDLAPY
ncbi:M15 family metallopeptidase domain-containing protein, partial [Herbiconiux daphne]